MKRKWIGIAALALLAAPRFAQAEGDRIRVSRSAAPLVIDGKNQDPFWRDVPARALAPAEPGVPAGLGGEVRFAARGDYLCVLAHLPEPGGRVLARAIGRNPVWERDSPGSPPVEDRFRLLVTRGPAGDGREVSLEVNPWGGYRLEKNDQAVNADVLSAAAVTGEGWDAEMAIPLEVLGERPAIRLERIRSRRPLAPEFRWAWPGTGSEAVMELPAAPGDPVERPGFAPPALGNREPAMEVGRVLAVPGMEPDWDNPDWKDVPAFQLPRNEAARGAPRHPTEVRWVQDGRTLALLIRAAEPEPVVARAGGRDSAVAADDHIALHLATSGSAFLEFAVNSVGAIQDSLAAGPHIERPQPEWNAAGFEVRTNIRYGAWMARINIPLAECAIALGETGVPRDWRIAISRYRAARPGEAAEISAVPPTGTQYFYGPAQYRHLVLAEESPARAARVDPGFRRLPAEGLAAELARLDANVWPPSYRRYHSVRNMLSANQRRRVDEAVLSERAEWDRIRTKEDWERYRGSRMKSLRESIGVFPPERSPLDARITARHTGNGYRMENVVYQTRPGFWAAANLYLPATGGAKMPAIVIQHSQHYPRIQGELHDMGELWARKGAAVLLLERLGFGERVETTPLYRQAYASRFTFKKQLNLIGESHTAWMAWDIIRAIDLLYERPEIDRSRIILIGAVAGGGEPAALAAALDPRISAVVPFNYDQGHVRLDADYTGEISKQISPWFITASIAPRRYVRAFEFGWEGAEEPDYPELWVSGWERSQKVWNLYGSGQNLAAIQAFGLIRLSIERIQHCFSVGPAQRKEMYPLFEEWFQIPSAAAEDAQTLPDSELTYNVVRAAARAQEAQRRRPQADLLCIPPKVSAELRRKSLHEIVHGMAARQLDAIREKRDRLQGAARLRDLRDGLRDVLGAIDPDLAPGSDAGWTRALSGARAEGIALHVERGIDVPLLFLKPANAAQKLAVVVAIAQDGKQAFLSNRAAEIGGLLRSGVAVCLPDLRGTGETSPDPLRGDHSSQTALAETEIALGGSLVGARLKDLRTVIVYVRTRPDADGDRIVLWGDSFAPPNTRELVMDVLQYEAGTQMEHQAEPAGALLAMLAALYDDKVRAVAALGGLAEFSSALENAFAYVSMDAIIPSVLQKGDIADIAAALAPRPLLFANAVNGRNLLLEREKLDRAFERVAKAYAGAGRPQNLATHPEAEAKLVTEWVVTALAK